MHCADRFHRGEQVVGALGYELCGFENLGIEEFYFVDEMETGDFILPGKEEMLRELREMVLHTNLSRGLFMANHASNYLPLKIRLPKDKESALATIDQALAGKVSLRAEWMRGL